MNPDSQGHINGVIKIRDLYKSFDDLTVLKGVSLELSTDENLVILGRSGMGKSVLIKCVVGLEVPEKGSIHVFGKDILAMNEFDLNRLRKDIGFLFQGGALYDSMTVEANLLFPLKRNARNLGIGEMNDRVDEALESVGLLDAKFKMPVELSGGMKKRAGLARTLVLKPKIILYDEPTTGLDPFTSKGISELIIEVKEKYKTTSIVVTHDMKCAKITADRIVVLDKGEILARGTYDELKKDPNKTIRGFFT